MFRKIETENSNLSNLLRQELSAFHAEERGASGTVDNIMIIFVAAVVLLLVLAFARDEVFTTVQDKVNELLQG